MVRRVSATAADRDVIRAGLPGIKGIVLKGCRVEYTDLAGSKGCNEERTAVPGYCHIQRRRETVAGLGRIKVRIVVEDAVIDVLVEMDRGDRRSADHGDSHLRQMALHRGTTKDPRSLKTALVLGVAVGNIKPAGCRIGDHVEQRCANMGEGRGLGQLVCIDAKHISVRQPERHGGIPNAPQFVDPMARAVVEFDDQGDKRRRLLTSQPRGGLDPGHRCLVQGVRRPLHHHCSAYKIGRC